MQHHRHLVQLKLLGKNSVKIPEPINSVAALIDLHHANQLELTRPHFGCSQAGHNCDRWLWLGFRWSVREVFPGRIKRLFRRGHNEEETVVADLRAIGCVVTDTTPDGEQIQAKIRPHLSGSLDGIIESGLPTAPNTRHILEIKTHALKSFTELQKIGVEKSKPQHFIQMQLYMHSLGIDRALYYSICKNDDQIYTERVKYDAAVAEKYITKSVGIIANDRSPEPMPGASPTWYQCKWCAGYDICYESKKTKEVNCRTCAHSSAIDTGWHCARFDKPLTVEAQRDGCRAHVLHPDLVPWDLVGGDGKSAEYKINGAIVINGESGISSGDLLNGNH